MPGGVAVGALESLDPAGLTVDIKKRGDASGIHPSAVFAHDVVRSNALQDYLRRIGEDVANNGIAGGGLYRTAHDVLMGEPPRLGGEPIRRSGETALAAAQRIARRGDFGVLPIQGPPGSGKTYTGARMGL